MVRLLIYIKHHLTFVWQIVEFFNSLFYRIRYFKKQKKIIPVVIKEFNLEGFRFDVLQENDLLELQSFIQRQAPVRLKYFKPHDFDINSLLKIHKNPAFLMMGAFDGSRMVGYFFLRFFWNRKCFVGRLIDEPFEGKGIGRVMNSIMYNIGWQMGFRVMSTISKNNSMVMKSHARNPHLRILKELDNDYLLVEFVREEKRSQRSEVRSRKTEIRGQKSG